MQGIQKEKSGIKQNEKNNNADLNSASLYIM